MAATPINDTVTYKGSAGETREAIGVVVLAGGGSSGGASGPQPAAGSQSVTPATNSAPFPTSGSASTASSALSGTIATSGGTAAITMTNTTRSEVINPSTGVLWASWGTPGVNAAGSFPINPAGSYNPPDRAGGTLTLLSTSASQPYTVNRFS